MRFEMTESNRHGMRGTAVIMGLVVAGAVVAFGCSDSSESGESSARLSASPEAQVRPVSMVSEPVTVVPAVVTVESEGELGTPKTLVPVNVSFEDGEGAYRARDYERALVLFEAYVERKPGNAWGHYMLGLSAWKAGELEHALGAFEQALVIDSTHTKSYFNLGRVLLELERPEEALAEFEAGIEFADEPGDGYRLVGRAFQQLGDSESALSAYQDALVQNGEDAWSMNNMALILIQASRSEDAVGPLARAAQLRDDLAVVRNNLGMALELIGHFEEAAQAYRDALAIDQGYFKAEENLKRVDGVTQRPDIESIDLGLAADRFVETIDTWSTPEVSELIPEFIEEPLVRDTVSALVEEMW